jgi:hypothetical protein
MSKNVIVFSSFFYKIGEHEGKTGPPGGRGRFVPVEGGVGG